MCVQVTPAILSRRRCLSVAPRVARWLINMRPSRGITAASEKPANKHTNAHFGQQKHFSFPLSSPLSSPSPSLRFISTADDLCRAVGLQYFHDVSQTHLGLNILFTSSQHSENHNNTELRQKFRTHYSLFRSRPRSKSSPSPLLCPCCLQRAHSVPPHPIYTCFHVMLCEQISHICSRYFGLVDN